VAFAASALDLLALQPREPPVIKGNRQYGTPLLPYRLCLKIGGSSEICVDSHFRGLVLPCNAAWRRLFAPRGATLSPKALEREAAVRARAAEREEEQQRRTLRARGILSFFFARLGVSEQQRVRRPRKGDNLRREQAHALACAYSSLPRDAAEEAENVTPEAWLLGSKCRALCREKGWLDLHEPAAAKPAADG